ncbi:Hypothetical protein NTJ_00542 [Nesidiocoris tenuis]|uniref:Uncharacterized protein n=1 Tax=Nesidiocoris tenuis TaxID=355587 RepID=A0ABN7A926_9HEMI|nr:Hypothetical protein NTJ_00542 [Nesidiocoris tenuis]
MDVPFRPRLIKEDTGPHSRAVIVYSESEGQASDKLLSSAEALFPREGLSLLLEPSYFVHLSHALARRAPLHQQLMKSRRVRGYHNVISRLLTLVVWLDLPTY